MKQEWLQKYREVEEPEFNSTVLTGFNANIDIITDQKKNIQKLEKVKAEKKEEINDKEDLLKSVKYCKENKTSYEAQLKYKPEIKGEKRLGGQAGIISNLENRLGNTSIIYTPFLTEELSDLIDEEVLYPVKNDSFGLKPVKDSINSDRTKENYIIEFKEDNTRLILSGQLRGFEPFFRQSIAEKLDKAEQEIDRIILSGFHDAEGNFETKLEKAEKQLKKIKTPKHLEYVSTTTEKTKQILNHIAPHFTSIGLDQQELQKIAEILGEPISKDPTLQEGFKTAQKITKQLRIPRIHIHTKKYHTTITKDNYPFQKTEIQKAMLKASLTAATAAQKGKTPQAQNIKLDTDQMHVKITKPLEKFQEKHKLENFVKTGTTELQNHKIIAIPPLITEKAEKIVGLGDIISATAFTAEINK